MQVTITAYRRGWFWPEPVRPGQTLDMPGDVAEYLSAVGAAEPTTVQPADGAAQPAAVAVELADGATQPAAVDGATQPAAVADELADDAAHPAAPQAEPAPDAAEETGVGEDPGAPTKPVAKRSARSK